MPPFFVGINLTINRREILAYVGTCDRCLFRLNNEIGFEMRLLELYRIEKGNVWRSMGVIAAISIISNLCLLTIPLYLSQVYSRVLLSRSIETLVALTILAVVMIITYGILDVVRSNYLVRVGIRLEGKLSGQLLANELAQSRGSSYSSLNQLAEIRKLLSSNIFPSLFDLPVLIIFTGIVFAIDSVLGLIVLAGMALLIFTAILSEILTSKMVRETDEESAAARKQLAGHFGQQELIRALGLYPQSVAHWGKLQARYLTKMVALLERTNALSSTSKAVRQLIQIAIIGGGAMLVIEDNLSAGIIFASSIIASRALAPIESLVSGWRILKQGRVALAKLESRIEGFSLSDGLTQLPRPSGALAAERVFFAHSPGGPALLKGITGGFRPGESVAVVGSSGAGKSTFVRLLVGYLEPTGGRVTLDGQDISAWDPVTRGGYMGYMPQQISFFEGTIRENIARLRIEDDPELAIEAAKFVGVHDIIMRFPMGYDTVISENGFQPSGGQKQLLGLARAFYGGPAFVVLDEPNASLDTEGEQVLFQTVKKASMAGIATIVVTQRLSLLQHVDKVLILKNGVVDKYGAPSDIMPGQVVLAVSNKAS